MACNGDILFHAILFFLIITNIVESSISPSAFVFPISKDASTHKHTITIHKGTPSTAIGLAIDLGGPYLWKTCGDDKSATHESIPCHSPQCSLAKISAHSKPKCKSNTTCSVYSENIFKAKFPRMTLSKDVLNLQSTDGSKPTCIVPMPFLFLCSPPFHSKEKPSRANGIAGLGFGLFGLPSQIFTVFNISRKFSICLSASRSGVLFFGDGPYVFSPGIDLAKVLVETPLYLKPQIHIGHHEHFIKSNEYFIKVSSLRVDMIEIPLNSSLLAKISTNFPYTYLETSLYTAVKSLFIDEVAADFSRVAPKAPFNICYSTRNQSGDVAVLDFPIIDFVLQSERVFLRVFGGHSMVQMGNDTMCLGIFDGGVASKDPIRIGTNVLENNLLQFNLESSTLGFTSLVSAGTDCASFNFTGAI